MAHLHYTRLAAAVFQSLEPRTFLSGNPLFGLSLSAPLNSPVAGPPSAILAINDYFGGGTATANSNGTVSALVNDQPTLTFQDGLGPASQGLPMLLAQADLNGDGLDDLVIFNPGSNRGSVMLGKNNIKTFRSPHLFAVNGNVESVALADVTGDGKPDLILGYFDGTISVLPGNGDGTFQHSISIATSGKPVTSITPANFGGTDEDLVVTRQGGGVILFRSTGNGGFTHTTVFSPDARNFHVAVGDVNSDGENDLIVVDGNGTVNVLVGNGDGSFQSPRKSQVPRQVAAVTLGDVNSEGNPDLITIGSAGVSVSMDLITSVNSGPNTPYFVGYQSYSVGGDPVAVVVEDANGDGLPDILTADETSNAVTELRNQSTGTYFSSPAVIQDRNQPTSIMEADLNGDGNPDLLVTTAEQAPELSEIQVFLNSGNGAFEQIDAGLSVVGYVNSIAVADVNGDGIPDVIVSAKETISVFLGNGDGTFKPAVTTSLADPAESIAVADLNGDGKTDLVVAQSGYSAYAVLPAGSQSSEFPPDRNAAILVLLGNGDGAFASPTTYTVGPNTDYLGPVTTADLNGDGHPDIVFTNRTDPQVSVMLNNGDGTFAAPVNYALPGKPGALAIGNLTGKGPLDIVTADDGVGDISVLLGNGDGTFAAPQDFAAGNSYPSSIAIDDFNGDGHADIVVAAASNVVASNFPAFLDLEQGTSSYDTVQLLLGNGDGTFAKPRHLFVGNNVQALAAADFNGDGQPDLVVVDAQAVRVLLHAPSIELNPLH
jgi:FG-GAP-like repeat